MKDIISILLLIPLRNIDCIFWESESDTTFSVLIFKLTLKNRIEGRLGLKNFQYLQY